MQLVFSFNVAACSFFSCELAAYTVLILTSSMILIFVVLENESIKPVWTL